MVLTNKDSFVFYRKPQSKEINYVIGEWSKIKEINSLAKFTFTVFNGESHQIFGEKKILKDEIIIHNNEFHTVNNITKEKYIHQANEYIELCKKKIIEKIVLSRIVKSENNFSNIFLLFEKLCNRYEHSFNYVLNHPKLGMWMGASPEILLKCDVNGCKTIALAGSKKWDNQINWRNKEIEEQQYVKNYIEKILNKHSNNVECIRDLETVKAGNIAHLKSTFNFNIQTSIHQLIADLHPTPAVCGIPLESTKHLIHKNEQHNRSLYTGFLGELTNNETSLFVNLRCMKINANEFKIYVGGGITAKSNAEEEWEETEIKAQTMLSLIEN